MRAPYRGEVPGLASSLNRVMGKPSNRPRPLDAVLNMERAREEDDGRDARATSGDVHDVPDFCSVRVTRVVTSAETPPPRE